MKLRDEKTGTVIDLGLIDFTIMVSGVTAKDVLPNGQLYTLEIDDLLAMTEAQIDYSTEQSVSRLIMRLRKVVTVAEKEQGK